MRLNALACPVMLCYKSDVQHGLQRYSESLWHIPCQSISDSTCTVHGLTVPPCWNIRVSTRTLSGLLVRVSAYICQSNSDSTHTVHSTTLTPICVCQSISDSTRTVK